MNLFKCTFIVLMLGCMSPGFAQTAQKDPHIGYLYPAGGRQGETVRVYVGGQFIRGAKQVMVTGEGIQANVVHSYQTIRNINGDQRNEIGRRLWEAWETRRNELPPEQRKDIPTAESISPTKGRKPVPANPENAKLPDYPLFNTIENMNLWELANVIQEVQNYRKRQQNAQLSDLVEIEVCISADAMPGDRELRLYVNSALTNPIIFQVGKLPEVLEQEPNDPENKIKLPEMPPLKIPVLLNGQIKPGDADRFVFEGRKGQQIVAETAARHLIPYLADAVPGWFQAVVSLYDDEGKEIAYADDYRFNPDPVLVCILPKDGAYTLEIRDAIYRGRDDFIYRVAVGELPFVTDIFPLGGQVGNNTSVKIRGYNLPVDMFALDVAQEALGVRKTNLDVNCLLSNDILYAVNDLPECIEAEPNNASDNGQLITLPTIVNGRIDEPGDTDVFALEGHAGEELVVEVFARRLASPMDSLVRILDSSNAVLAWNDDSKDKFSELLTHHADSKIQAILPADGTYLIQVSDVQHNGGKEYAYRLHVRKPNPDFALLVTPSSVNIPPGGIVDLCVHAVRREGFTGDITLLLENAPKGFRIDGGRIPAGKDTIRFTLAAPVRPVKEPVPILIAGTAANNGENITRTAVPAEDMMQAFLPRHLVSSQQLLVAVKPGKQDRQVRRLNDAGPVLIQRGGKSPISMKIPSHPEKDKIVFALKEAPDGFSLENIEFTQNGLTFFIKAAGNVPEPGYEDNLIISATLERPVAKKSAAAKQETVNLGVLPAIPIKITE